MNKEHMNEVTVTEISGGYTPELVLAEWVNGVQLKNSTKTVTDGPPLRLAVLFFNRTQYSCMLFNETAARSTHRMVSI